MKKLVASALSASVLLLFAAFSAGAQTLVPREKIPSDASPRVKELIEQLYSDNEAVAATAAVSLGEMQAAANIGVLERNATASIPFIVGLLYDERRLQLVSDPFKMCSPTSVVPCPIRGEPTTVSRVAARALARMGAPAFQPVLDAFITGQPNRHSGRGRVVQEAAAHALGLLKDTRAVDPLLRAFGDPSMKEVRGSVALTLGQLGDARAFDPLISALKDETVRSQAVEALGNLHDRRAMEPLLELLARTGTESRWLVAEAVVKMGKPRPMDRLIPLLNSSDSSIEEAATLAIGQIGVEDRDQSVIPLLAPKLSNRYTTGTYSVTYLAKLAKQSWELEIKDQAAVDALISAVGIHNTQAAVVATEILGDAKIQRAIPAIANGVIYGSLDYSGYSGYSNTGTNALKKINANAAIELMIGLALEKKCGTAAGCDKIFLALRKITDEDLWNADAVAWQRWWSRNKPRPPARRRVRRR